MIKLRYNKAEESDHTNSDRDEFYLEDEDLRESLRSLISNLDGSSLVDAWFVVYSIARKPPPVQAEPPQRPPAKWEDRPAGVKTNPCQFIRDHYASYIGAGLTRPALKRLDEKLYDAYAKWIKRHPEDDLNLPMRTGPLEDQISHLPESVKARIAELGPALYARGYRPK